jgi:DNA-binding transcriptional ArsR family regulator
MIVLDFEVADLAKTRFAISPLYELVESLRLLRAPERAAAHIPWMRRALPVARTLPLATAFGLTPRRPPVPAYYMPDFLVPPPVSPVATLSEELERLRATPEEQVRADVMRMLGSSEPPAVLAELLEDAPRALGQLADALGAYWAEVIEPEWPRILALLDADLAYRAQRLTTGGHASLFSDLNRLVRFSESRLELELITDATVGLRGQGLLLVPSVFQWERPAVVYDAPWQPTLLYPARGVALLWEAERPQPGAALAGVLGSTRAQVLVTLDAPRTTTELAPWLGVRASGVSAHLGALLRAGLVSRTRHGRSVLYARTELAVPRTRRRRFLVGCGGGGRGCFGALTACAEAWRTDRSEGCGDETSLRSSQT